MNDDTSTYISDLLSFIWGPLEKRKKKESDFTQSMYGISFRRPSLQRVVSIHLILSPGISKKCLLKELMVQHFGWTADWWEETTHTVRWAEVLNSISQGNKIILKVRQLHLDAISQHIFPPSPEALSNLWHCLHRRSPWIRKVLHLLYLCLLRLVAHAISLEEFIQESKYFNHKRVCDYRQPMFLVLNLNSTLIRTLPHPEGQSRVLTQGSLNTL